MKISGRLVGFIACLAAVVVFLFLMTGTKKETVTEKIWWPETGNVTVVTPPDKMFTSVVELNESDFSSRVDPNQAVEVWASDIPYNTECRGNEVYCQLNFAQHIVENDTWLLHRVQFGSIDKRFELNMRDVRVVDWSVGNGEITIKTQTYRGVNFWVSIFVGWSVVTIAYAIGITNLLSKR